jgi:hypothetical protein
LRVLLPLLALVAAAGAANSVSSIKWRNTDFVGVATADVHLPVVEGELLMLSKGAPNGAAAAWLAHPHMLSNGFSLSFTFRALVSQSMDGFAVVFQSDPAQSRALGKPGENLGYAGLKSSVAIGALFMTTFLLCATRCSDLMFLTLVSFALELDCFKNPDLLDPDGNHISIHTMKVSYCHLVSERFECNSNSPRRRSQTTQKKHGQCRLRVVLPTASAASRRGACRACPSSQTLCPTPSTSTTPAPAPQTRSPT